MGTRQIAALRRNGVKLEAALKEKEEELLQSKREFVELFHQKHILRYNDIHDATVRERAKVAELQKKVEEMQKKLDLQEGKLIENVDLEARNQELANLLERKHEECEELVRQNRDLCEQLEEKDRQNANLGIANGQLNQTLEAADQRRNELIYDKYVLQNHIAVQENQHRQERHYYNNVIHGGFQQIAQLRAHHDAMNQLFENMDNNQNFYNNNHNAVHNNVAFNNNDGFQENDEFQDDNQFELE